MRVKSRRLKTCLTSALLVTTAFTFPALAYAESPTFLIVGKGGNGGVSAGTNTPAGGGGGGIGGGGGGGGGLSGGGGGGGIVGGSGSSGGNGGNGGSGSYGGGMGGSFLKSTSSGSGSTINYNDPIYSHGGGISAYFTPGGSGGIGGGGGISGVGGGGGGGYGGGGGGGAGTNRSATVPVVSGENGASYQSSGNGSGGQAITSANSGVLLAGGGNGASSEHSTDNQSAGYTYTPPAPASYDAIGIGGGGGGGGGGGTYGGGGASLPYGITAQGGNGDSGTLILNSTNALTINPSGYALIGGGGGGAGGGTNSNDYSVNGGNGGAGEVDIYNGGSLTLGESSYLLIGGSGGGGGGSNASGASGGDGGSAILNINNGGNLTAGEAATVTLGGGGGSSGGSSSAKGGAGGAGTLNINSGGTFTVQNTALLFIGGTSDSVTTNYIGAAGGAGTLNINNGGLLTVGDSASIVLGGLGGNAGSLSAIDAGPNGGTGTLNINNGGTLKIGKSSNVVFGGIGGADGNGPGFSGIPGQDGPGSSEPSGGAGGNGTLALSDGTLILGDQVTLSPKYFIAGSTSVSDESSTSKTGPRGTASFTLSGTQSVIEVDNSDSATIATPISGTGTLNKTGTGTLSLASTNSYSGGTVIDAGEIAISKDDNLGTGAVTLNGGGVQTTIAMTSARNYSLGAEGGTIDTDGNNASFTGNISGVGGLTKAGIGTLTLNSANNYTGGTSIEDGTLALGPGGSLAATGPVSIASGATFDISQSNNNLTVTDLTGATGASFKLGSHNLTSNVTANTNFAGAISGSGGLTKTGTGTLTLDGINSYTGATSISAGTLEIGDASSPNASITSDVTVQAAGTLRGHGTITGNVVNDGIVYPGGSTGILHIDGNYTQNSDGTLEIGIAAPQGNNAPVSGTDNDQLTVSGAAVLNGTILVNAAQGGYKVGQTYDVLRANSITGSPITHLGGPYGEYLSVLGQSTGNTYKIGITAFTNPEGGSTGSGGSGSASTGNSSPNGGAGVPGPAFTSGRFYGASLYVQNASLFAALSSPAGTGTDYWMHGIGSFGHLPGNSYNYKGYVIGRGFAINPHLILGGAVTNIYTNSTGSNNSSALGTSVGAELYAIYTLPRWTLTGSAMIGHLGNRATRYLPEIGAGKFATNGAYSGTSLRVQYNWLNAAHIFVTPYAGLSYLYTTTGSGQETGLNGAINMNLHYGRVSTSLAQARGGFTVGYRTTSSYGPLTSWVNLGGLGTLGNRHVRVQETLGLENAGITSQIASAGAFTPAIGMQLAGKNARWKLGASWQGQFANRASSQAFTLQGSYKF